MRTGHRDGWRCMVKLVAKTRPRESNESRSGPSSHKIIGET
ncbi:hypothetical protein RISK_002575 [Rhodopirellula islandica]|uniref:Uncharacterized protein n=1 Tax=Rhodopirellula islandica TaxID=595434 RepID=A0A0J1BFK1_RHOIS|nr:hypothetical protein RISK_002575 [Rhodopirellula islandica]